jgi:hypothetical protein
MLYENFLEESYRGEGISKAVASGKRFAFSKVLLCIGFC